MSEGKSATLTNGTHSRTENGAAVVVAIATDVCHTFTMAALAKQPTAGNPFFLLRRFTLSATDDENVQTRTISALTVS